MDKNIRPAVSKSKCELGDLSRSSKLTKQAQQSLKLLGPLTPRSKKYQTANATVDKKPHRGRFYSDGEWQEACDDRDSGERDIWPKNSSQPTSQVTPSTFISSSNYASLRFDGGGAAEPPAAPAAPPSAANQEGRINQSGGEGLEGLGPLAAF
uniref:Uncharacterized protein n=1 Tax=Macrostomum lignano TaxID=282301 RepID=A0A1I8IFS9_9PLAT